MGRRDDNVRFASTGAIAVLRNRRAELAEVVCAVLPEAQMLADEAEVVGSRACAPR